MRKHNPTPWADQAFFSLDGIPVIDRLRSAWWQIREEYDDNMRCGATPYPLTEIYSGRWLVTSLRSNPVELGYFSVDQRAAEIEKEFCVSVAAMTPEEIIAAHEECCEKDQRINRVNHPTLTTILDPLYPHACFMIDIH